MIRTQTCITLECNGCKEPYQWNDDFISHHPDVKEARTEASNGADWWSDGEIDLCEDCRNKPHAFVPEVGDEEFCDRCGLEVEGHAPDTQEDGPGVQS